MIEVLIYSMVAFLAGMLTFLAPCTLPILAAYFAYSGTSDRKQITINTILFGTGLAIVFTSMGIFAGSIGGTILTYKREIVYIFGTLMILFGFMSIFEKSFKSFNLNIKIKKTKLGSVIFGGVFALTWTGCVGPILGFMLVMAANTQTAFSGGLMLLFYSLGIILPLILLSLFLDKLPKDGRFWKIMKGKEYTFSLGKKKIHVHSNNLITGILFIIFGLMLLTNFSYFMINAFPGITEIIFDLEDKISLLMG